MHFASDMETIGRVSVAKSKFLSDLYLCRPCNFHLHSQTIVRQTHQRRGGKSWHQIEVDQQMSSDVETDKRNVCATARCYIDPDSTPSYPR